MELHFATVTHEVKVSYLGNGKYGCRVLTDGVVSQERTVDSKADIGPACREMLRMEHKCGNDSDFADNARHRATRKELARKRKV